MATTSSESNNLDHHRLVCVSCKLRKRRCNKALPKCSSCFKRSIKCEYLSQDQARAAERQQYVAAGSADALTTVQTIDFPTVLFLDPGLLTHGQVDFPHSINTVPGHILRLIGDTNQAQNAAERFFNHIHTWMPFISKKRFYDSYLRLAFPPPVDIALLLSSLELITAIPPTDPRNPRTAVYYAVKHFCLEIQSSSTISIAVLQALVLITLYELGHGIYPAVFLSIGTCARYGHALGIDSSNTMNVKRALTLIELEERRRTWWAIVILDRFINIGCPGRPFVTSDPGLDDVLPADDISWDKGIIRPQDSIPLSSPKAAHMSKYSLLCQAARLLGLVLRHVASNTANDDGVWMQLDRTLHSMLAAALDMESPDHDQIAFIYSSIVALFPPSLCRDSDDIIDQDRALRAEAVVQEITDTVNKNLIHQQCFLGRDPEDLSPWGLYFAYYLCRHYICNEQEEESQASNIVQSLKEGLTAVDARWNVAGVYLQLLEAHEVTRVRQ